jgi:hypothetical protein
VHDRPRRMTRRLMLQLTATAPVAAWAQQEPAPKPAEGSLPPPPEIPNVPLGPVLKTTPIRRESPGPNFYVVDASPLPKDREGIWILDFAFKPMRIVRVDLPGKGRRPIHYLYYRVINRTGEPRMFVPQFTVVTDTRKRYEDQVIPQAVEVIRAREDATKDLYGNVDAVGILPPSGSKQGIDDAIFGVAVWDGIDPHADRFSVYVRGLSNGYRTITPPGGGEPQIQYKTLRIDFLRPGDEFNLNEREIRLADPPYEWIYW